MSSAIHDSDLDQVRQDGPPRSGEGSRPVAEPSHDRPTGRAPLRQTRDRGSAQPPGEGSQRRVRNVRPLPVTPPPFVNGPPNLQAPPEAPPAANEKAAAAAPVSDVDVQARRPVSHLRRSSRVKGTGVVVTLITGTFMVIVLAVALIFALKSDPPAQAPSGPNVVLKNADGTPYKSAMPNGTTAFPPAMNKPSGANLSGANEAPQTNATGDVASNQPGAGNNAASLPTDRNSSGSNANNGNSAARTSAPPRQQAAPPNAEMLAGLPTSYIMDDGDARLTGDWNIGDRSQEDYKTTRYHGEAFRIDSGTFGEHAAAQYIFPPLRPGPYKVSISYPTGPNRASNVTVIVTDADGKHEVEVDQTEPPERGLFLPLGEFRVDASQPLVVSFDNEGIFGYLAIDAVKAENLESPPAAAAGSDDQQAANTAAGDK